ncbi:MAG: hypothetical protein GY715_18110 [Planctomycetes bacterium]|nr:hypothetical protein [Planctomycetota bacterium]
MALCAAAVVLSTAAHAGATQDKVSATEKGSIVIFSKVDIRWDAAGFLTQDTFLSLTNDYPGDVLVQMYFINGDAPLDADGAERAHPGWNWIDNLLPLTGDQPTYWSAVTGQPAGGGLSPFTALDPGFPPGRPDAKTGGRMLRGYIIAWAVNAANNPIRWNHLKGEGTIVNYLEGSAWEYNTWNHQAICEAHGMPTVQPANGEFCIPLEGIMYSASFDQLLMNFQAVGSSAFSGPRLVTSNTDLTLFPCSVDLRQETCGPVTTKAHIDVWNMNEVKFSGAHRCITCWDQTTLDQYEIPNHFLMQNLQTDHGKARIDGQQSQVCDVDVDPDDGIFPPADPCNPVIGGVGEESHHPDDVVSMDVALLGVVARLLTYDGGADNDTAGTNLIGMGTDIECRIYYDEMAPPPEAVIPDDIDELIEILGGTDRPAPTKRKATWRR